MRRTIWKYEIPLLPSSADPGVTHPIPDQARFLACAEQWENIALWYEIPDVDAPKRPHLFRVFGTGHADIPDGFTYRGTTLHTGGSLVLHTYEAVS